MAYTTALSPIEGVDSLEFWIAGTNLGAKAGEYDKYYWITNDRPVGNLNEFENWFEETPFIPNVCMATYLGSAKWIYGDCVTPKSGYACEESQDV
uniref:C-type lectin domain-containing protein n=1 Tax=Anopheles atroparvus TaxID=41427 RepID=A0AAG5D1J2_ANOAO